MALAVEGAASTMFSGAGPATVNITTSGTDRIIVVAVGHEEASAQTSVPTATGLTFALRKRYTETDNGGRFNVMETFWAYAAAQQTAKTITVTMSGAIDDAVIGVFAVSGVGNFVTPWDSNAALPATADTFSANTPPPVSGVSTTSAPTLMFGFFGARDGCATTVNTGAGWTSILNVVNGGGSLEEIYAVASIPFATAQSGITATPFITSPNHSIVVIDALVGVVISGTVKHSSAVLVG